MGRADASHAGLESRAAQSQLSRAVTRDTSCWGTSVRAASITALPALISLLATSASLGTTWILEHPSASSAQRTVWSARTRALAPPAARATRILEGPAPRRIAPAFLHSAGSAPLGSVCSAPMASILTRMEAATRGPVCSAWKPLGPTTQTAKQATSDARSTPSPKPTSSAECSSMSACRSEWLPSRNRSTTSPPLSAPPLPVVRPPHPHSKSGISKPSIS